MARTYQILPEQRNVVGPICEENVTTDLPWRSREAAGPSGDGRFYYTAIYDVLQNRDLHATKATILKKLKTKIVRLHSAQWMDALTDTLEQDRMLGEEPSLHHFPKGPKRQEQRTVHQMYGNIGTQHTSSTDILRIFTKHMRCKYDHDECARRITDCGRRTIPPAANEALEEPITMDELLQAIKRQSKGGSGPWWDMLGILQGNVGVHQTRLSGCCKQHVNRWANYRTTKTCHTFLHTKEFWPRENRGL